MAKQIKAYVDVEPYVDVSHGRGADSAALLASVLVTGAFGNALAHLAESACGASNVARILSGPQGVGKSTALTFLYALAANPSMRTRASDQQVRTAASYLSGSNIIPVFADPEAAGAGELDEAFREAFAAAAPLANAAGIGPGLWSAAATGDDPIGRSVAALPAGWRIVLFVDGVASWARTADRDAVRRASAQLARIGELSSGAPLSVVVTLDERSLDGADGPFLPLLRSYQVEYLPLEALADACDRFVFKKDPRQRAELGALFDDLKRTIPSFRWPRDEFVALYPLHPATLEIAPALARHAPNFSFLRFAATAGNRAKGRRDLSLVVLDELFDACEYELRKAPEIAAGFSLYDDFANGVIPKLADSQQRFRAKLVLKGLFLSSLAGRAVSAQTLADAMMLFDEANPTASAGAVAEILSAFEERATQRFVAEGEGIERTYLLPVAEENSGARVLAEIAREIPVDDPRIGDALVALGRARFADWPEALDGSPASVRLEVMWRGTARTGLLAYRMPASLVEIPAVVAEIPNLDALSLDDLDDDDVLGIDRIDEPATSAERETARVVLSYEAPGTLCEDDWEIFVATAGATVELRDGPPTMLSWVPGRLDDADLQVLRRLVALETADARLEAPGIDVASLRAEAEAEGGLLFHHLYVEKGRFATASREIAASSAADAETLEGLLARVLDAPLEERYPQHPEFAADLDEASARLLVERFFASSGTSAPPVQQAAAAFAAPLGLADPVGENGPYRFNASSETALGYPFNAEPLRLADAAGDEGAPIAAVYQTLRREPYGLQRCAQWLVLAGAAASGRLEVVSGDRSSADGIASGPEFDERVRVVRSGLTAYSNETLLEWARLLTEADHLNDLVTHDGRQLVRRALEEWLERWRELDLKGRFGEVPSEAATRRTWQLITASRQFFEMTARTVEAIFDEELALEEGLGRIVTTFAANPTIYQRALRDQRTLTSFIEWVPFYAYAKEYLLSADRTAEEKIEAERAELLDFVSAPHRLLDESKRRRFETVYETFLHDYVDYYTTAHDLHVGGRADFEALDAYLEGPAWRRFELLSQIRTVDRNFYRFASDIVRSIRDLACDLPVRELLHERPTCVCGFRLGHSFDVARLFDRLRLVVEQGTPAHLASIRRYRRTILAGIRELQGEEDYGDVSSPLIALLSGNPEAAELTPPVVDLVNQTLAGASLPVEVVAPPALEPGTPMTKEQLRAHLLRWVDDLPGEDEMLIEVAPGLPASGDE